MKYKTLILIFHTIL